MVPPLVQLGLSEFSIKRDYKKQGNDLSLQEGRRELKRGRNEGWICVSSENIC